MAIRLRSDQGVYVTAPEDIVDVLVGVLGFERVGEPSPSLESAEDAAPTTTPAPKRRSRRPASSDTD